MKKVLLFVGFVLGVLGLAAILLSQASSDIGGLEVEPDFDDMEL